MKHVRMIAGITLGLVVLLAGLAAAAGRREGAAHPRSGSLAEEARRLVALVDQAQKKEGGLATRHDENLVAEGEDLFFNGTFDGNGRTCGTCHRAEDGFGLSPASIAAMPPSDLLFIAELDANLTGLEHPPLMRSPRGLILENIDGFVSPPVFRNSPHLLNLARTAPYGLSGEFADLRTFSMGAVVQHFPKTLAREPGVDFRLPTAHELEALEAFMQSIAFPADQGVALSRFVSTVPQRRGSDLFFGTAQCFNCHNGPVLADAVPALGGGNRNFNTGVANLRINQENRPENPGGGALPPEVGGAREFNTPPLIGVAGTAPFFHDSSVATLRDAVEFYDSFEFASSPGGALVGQIVLTPAQVDDITAFLESLRPLTFEASPGALHFGAREITAGPSAPLTVTLQSHPGAEPLTVEGAALSGGPTDGEFDVQQVDAATFEVTFHPTAVGQKRAVLQIDTDAGPIGVLLTGTGVHPTLPTFSDVPPGDPAFPFVEAVFRAGLTSGCGGGRFCPDNRISRAEIAVWLVLAMGNTDVPPRRLFNDVTPATLGAGYIERLAADGVTAGCGNGNYCPGSQVTRRQLAVFLVAGSGRTPVSPPTGIFADVPPGSPAAGFIERLALDGITAGCGNGNFCPDSPATRRQAAIFLARAFDLPLP